MKPEHSFTEDDVLELPKVQEVRKSSMARVMNKILYNPNRKEVHSANVNVTDGGGVSGNGRKRSGGRLGLSSELAPVDRASYQNQFRLRGLLQNSDHKILQMSRNAILSVISAISAFYCKVGVGGTIAGGVFSPRKFSVQMMRKVSVLPTYIDAGEPTTKITLDPNSVLVRLFD